MAPAPGDPAALRATLERLALAGATWHTLLARFARAADRCVRLLAADGALLVEVPAPAHPGDAPPASSPEHDRFDVPRLYLVAEADLERIFAASGAVDVVCTDGVAMRAVALAAGERRVGALAVGGSGPELDAYLDSAVTSIAIEAVRRDARASAVAESAGWLVDELRFGSSRPPDDLVRVARRYGLELDAPHAAVALEYEGPDLRTWSTSLSWLESPVRTEAGRAWTVISGSAGRESAWIQRRLQPFVRGTVRVAAGATVVGAAATPHSFELADGALAVLRRRTDRVDITFDDLGLTGLLLTVPRARLDSFVERSLGRLLTQPDLLVTLGAWYDSGGSRAQVAESVSIHRNSVGHRMERIRALLGADPDDAAISADLRAALAAREVLAALDHAPGAPATHSNADPAVP